MNWNAKIKAALHGEVDGSDVAAQVAAAYSLESLRQGVADRRLEAEIAHAGEEWRVTDDLATVEAPLWWAEALVALAQSLVEGEAEAHPDRPKMMSTHAHDEALALIKPVEGIIAAVSASLVDPSRQLPLRAPSLITPVGTNSGGVPVAYVRGLQRGAERLEGMAQTALDGLAKLASRSQPPVWLNDGLRALRADMAGAQATLQGMGMRVSSLVATQAGGDANVRQLANELWGVINAYLHVGQLAIAPRLMPGAPGNMAAPPSPPQYRPQGNPNWQQPMAPQGNVGWSSPPAPPPPVATNWTPAPQAPPNAAAWTPPPTPQPPMQNNPAWTPPPPAIEEPARTLPPIAPTWERTQAPTPPPVAPEPEARPLPKIESPSTSATGQVQHASPVTPAHVEPRSVPKIEPPAARAGSEPRSVPTIETPMAGHPQAGAGGQPPPLPKIEPPAARVGGAPGSLPKIEPPTARTGSEPPPTDGTAPAANGGRPIARTERWLLSSTPARRGLRARGEEDHAEQELGAFWQSKGWALSPADQAYVDGVAALVASGAVAPSGRSLAYSPYAPIYRVTRNGTTLLGQQLPANTLFAFDYRASRLLPLNDRDGVPD